MCSSTPCETTFRQARCSSGLQFVTVISHLLGLEDAKYIVDQSLFVGWVPFHESPFEEHDLPVLKTLHAVPGSIFQHACYDVLPQEWSLWWALVTTRRGYVQYSTNHVHSLIIWTIVSQYWLIWNNMVIHIGSDQNDWVASLIWNICGTPGECVECRFDSFMVLGRVVL